MASSIDIESLTRLAHFVNRFNMPFALLMMVEYVIVVKSLHASCAVEGVVLLLLVGLFFHFISSLPSLDNCLPAE